jgi:antibiotic biosynthesis monooxygenase (ABM) superfamily enzyme
MARSCRCESADTWEARDGTATLHLCVTVPLRLRPRFGSNDPVTPNAEPVTVTVARVVRPDQREAFEKEAADILAAAASFPGNLGATLLHPGPDSSEYHLVYRFADDESLAAWERSAQRRAFLDRMRHMVEQERYNRVAGLESFFTRAPRPGPRWRMTVLTIVAVFAITSTMQLLVMPLLSGWPMALRLLLSACVVVTLLGYLVMPALTKLFAGWLSPRRD